MNEILFDKKLLIKTTGIKEWNNVVKKYNRYESTSYSALEQLFKYYNIEPEDKLIDFGCGKGRVVFYIHNRFKIPVLGIEAQEDLYEEALNNRRRYLDKYSDIEASINFRCDYAELHRISPKYNKFFFFNPFSGEIFNNVLENIIHSLNEVNREIDIILYYPFPEYKKIIESKKCFKILNKISMLDKEDKLNEFTIYRYEPYI